MTKFTIFVAIYAAFCITKSFSKPRVTVDEITQLTEQLFKAADLSFYSQLTINTKKNPLLTIKEDVLTKSTTVKKLRDLFDNYEPDASIAEKETAAEIKEQDAFIEALLATNVIKKLMEFLVKKQAVANRHTEQFFLLKNHWFRLYSRGDKILGSCGFEHVFLHEIHQGDVLGLHNWIYFHDLQQKDQKLQFKQLKKQLTFDNKASALKFSFSYDNKVKPSGTMLVGTPPELDIALYSLCIAMEVEDCPISLGGQKFTIKAYSFNRPNNVKVIASGYPDI